jgi:uroporphyrinogen-III synthase
MTHRSVLQTDSSLRGIRVLVTRPREDVGSLRIGLERLGAEVFCLPTISIRPLTASPDVAAALARIGNFDWIAFTSRNAVRAVFDWLTANDRQPAPGVKVAAVGSATARELRARGVTPACMPADSSAQALAAKLIETGIDGCAVLLPLGNLAGDEARRALETAGAAVTAVRVYETVPVEPADPEGQDALMRGDIDVVALASPSAFQALLELSGGGMREPLRRTQLVAIGPTTAEAIRAAGYTPSAVSPTQTMEGMVQAIVDLYQLEPR